MSKEIKLFTKYLLNDYVLYPLSRMGDAIVYPLKYAFPSIQEKVRRECERAYVEQCERLQEESFYTWIESNKSHDRGYYTYEPYNRSKNGKFKSLTTK